MKIEILSLNERYQFLCEMNTENFIVHKKCVLYGFNINWILKIIKKITETRSVLQG